MSRVAADERSKLNNMYIKYLRKPNHYVRLPLKGSTLKNTRETLIAKKRKKHPPWVSVVQCL